MGDGHHVQIAIRTSTRVTRIRLVSSIEGIHAVVPAHYDAIYLSEFAKTKRDWLLRTSKYYGKLKERCGGVEPGTILYRGSRYRSNIVNDHHFSATVSDILKVITFHVPDMRKPKKYVQEWFRQQTTAIISERLPPIAEKLGVKYNRISVKKQESRWGSCSKKGNLNFNLMLAAAPTEVIDYVIIHELTHLVVLDHSSKFWRLVQKADPDYQAHRKWLSAFSPLITI